MCVQLQLALVWLNEVKQKCEKGKKKKTDLLLSRQKSDSFKIALVLAQFFFRSSVFFSAVIASDVGDDVIGFTNSGKGPNEQQKTRGPKAKLLKRSDGRFVQKEDVITIGLNLLYCGGVNLNQLMSIGLACMLSFSN